MMRLVYRQIAATVVCYAIVFSAAQAVRAAGTLDLTFDPETGSLTMVPTANDLQIISQRGLFTGIPTVGVFNLYDQYLRVLRPESEDSLELGPVITAGVTLEELAQDICVIARHEGIGYPPYDVIRLNGQLLHAEPASCPIPPPPFPPYSGEKTGILQYQSETGELRLRSQSPVAALEIQSSQHRFTGMANPKVFVGSFDINRSDKLYKWSPSIGYVELDYGPILPQGLTNHEVLSDICINGAWVGGGWVTLDYAYPGAGTVPIVDCRNTTRTTEVGLTVEYDVSSGEVSISAADLLAAPNPAGSVAAEPALLITTLDMRSASGIFTGGAALDLEGPFDKQTGFQILKQDREGFSSVNLGSILAPGLTQEFVAQDVTLDVTFLDRHTLKAVEVVTVPEPAGSTGLCLLAALALLRHRRYTQQGAGAALVRV